MIAAKRGQKRGGVRKGSEKRSGTVGFDRERSESTTNRHGRIGHGVLHYSVASWAGVSVYSVRLSGKSSMAALIKFSSIEGLPHLK